MNKPKPGQRVLASEHNPSVKAGTLIGHVISVTGDTFALKLDSGRVIYVPWRSVDGHNRWLVYEDDKTEDPPTQQPAYWPVEVEMEYGVLKRLINPRQDEAVRIGCCEHAEFPELPDLSCYLYGLVSHATMLEF